MMTREEAIAETFAMEEGHIHAVSVRRLIGCIYDDHEKLLALLKAARAWAEGDDLEDKEIFELSDDLHDAIDDLSHVEVPDAE